MLHVIIGIIAIFIGLWGIARNWYMFIDILVVLIPFSVIAFGIIALLAGLRSMRKSREQA